VNDLTSSCECKVEKNVMIDPLSKAVSFGRFAVERSLERRCNRICLLLSINPCEIISDLI